MKNPKVSVIVPVYNVEWNLDKCIQSLVKQTYSNLEIILINDGSKDKSLDVCLKYKEQDERIIVIDKPNTGVSDTRNIGIQNASGDYITFVDSDDWVDETYVEDFNIRGFQNDKSIVVQGIIYDYPRRNLHNIMFQYPNVKLIIPDSLTEIKQYEIFNNGCPVAKLFSSKIIKDNNIRFNTKLSLNEDHLFVLDYYRYTDEVILIDRINYHYFFDYQLPSLTKISHSSSEYIEIAKQISISFRDLSKRFGQNKDCLGCFSFLFGPNQLIKASKSAFEERESYKRFCNILAQWKSIGLKLIDHEQNCSIYIYFFNKCVKSRHKFLYYIILYLLFKYERFIYMLKFSIKKYFLKN